MKSILIIGAGSFSVEIDELARLLGYTDIAFLDDKSPAAIGTMQDIGKMRAHYDTAIVALGNNENRKRFHLELLRNNYNIPVLVHPTAYVSSDAQLSAGCIVRTNAVVSRYAKLGEGVIVNIGSLIDHHCDVGAFSMVLPGAVIRNSVKVEPESWIKANSIVE
jgi:UDP-3-O-[3-hydroxymyristoyl] glucosamine N-acyltransferase